MSEQCFDCGAVVYQLNNDCVASVNVQGNSCLLLSVDSLHIHKIVGLFEVEELYSTAEVARVG